MNIAVIGTGYVGLVTGTCFAEFGFNVTCVDRDHDKIEKLKNHIIPIYEPGLEDLVKKTVSSGCLHFTTDLQSTVLNSDIIFVAVGTPPLEENKGNLQKGEADLSQVIGACEEIAISLPTSKKAVVVIKSTVPVGTVRLMESVIQKANPAARFDMASNPEFLREGSAIEDFMQPDRIVVGTHNTHARDMMEKLYHPLQLLNVPVLFTSIETAELIKYASNAFLATKVAFINELANLCEKVGANVQEIAKGMGMDSRIGYKFLNAGPGYGGSCFPKDTRAISKTAQNFGTPLTIIDAVIESNDSRRIHMIDKIKNAFHTTGLNGKKIAILGITFKANTDDIRESISLDIIPALQLENVTLNIYDPIASGEGAKHFNNVNWFHSAYEAIDGCDGVVILTEWNEFRGLDLNKISSIMATPIIIDFRNLFDPNDMKSASIVYHSIGRPSVLWKTASIHTIAFN
jgi:UDPglucose 6-dehydrogenase